MLNERDYEILVTRLRFSHEIAIACKSTDAYIIFILKNSYRYDLINKMYRLRREPCEAIHNLSCNYRVICQNYQNIISHN